MKAVLIDSDIIVEVMRRRNSHVLSRWESLIQSSAPVACTPVTVAELWHGALPQEFPALESFFNALDCVSLDKTIGRKAGAYLQQFAKSHALEIADALIAATAAIHDLHLWTRNRKHYPMKDIAFF